MTYRILLVLILAVSSTARADNWPHWRGPHFNGSTTETNLPSDWSMTENVAWSLELSGAAASTPIVWEDSIFLSGVDASEGTLLAMCVDRKTGKLRWQHTVSEGIRRDDRSNFAAPSPVTDGQIVIFFYSNGDLIGYDFEGRRRWARNIQEDYGTFAFQWTFSSSPTLAGDKLYLPVLQRDVPAQGRGFADRVNESYLLAIDPKTGKTVWRHVRPSEARAESLESFATAIPFVHEGTEQLLIVGGDALTGHDLESGRELWRWGNWNPTRISHWRHVPSPVSGGGVVLACAPKRSPIYAVKAGLSGPLDDGALAWTSEGVGEISSDVPTPAFYDGDFFILSDVRKALSRIEPRTGRVKWTVPTPGLSKYEASPLAADGKIYLINFDGQVDVINAADGQIINSILMDEPAGDDVVRASIIASQGQLFIRTTGRLICVGSR